MTTKTELPEHVLEACAQSAHEMNRAYCIALGDTSQVSWETAPEWQKQSARHGVRGILIDGNSPEQSHESWLHEKKETGWKYGPVKDAEKKEHPCFVPYSKLPQDQKRKDSLFLLSVTSMAMMLGLEINDSALMSLQELLEDAF